MSERGDERINLRLMNEYSVEIPLWTEEGLIDGDELGLRLLRACEILRARGRIVSEMR